MLAVWRRRRLDPFAALSLSLTAIVAGLVTALVFGDGRVLLVKESLITGTLGVVFLGSLATSRPLVAVLRKRVPASGGRFPSASCVGTRTALPEVSPGCRSPGDPPSL